MSVDQRAAVSKETLQEWLTTIGGGTDPVGVEAVQIRRAAEGAVTREVLSRYWGYAFLGDAIHQLYMDTLREIAKIPVDQRSDPKSAVYVQWHVVAAGRFFSAFDLMTRGYFSEGASLARSLWETALTLAATQHQVVDVETFFTIPGIDKPTRDDYSRHSRETDRKIQNALIWKNTSLPDEGRQAVEGLHDLMNAATHKGILALALNNRRQGETGGVDLFPTFDAKMAEACFNILYLATWALFSTLRYLSPPLPGPSSPWGKRYDLALQAFEHSGAPNRIGNGFRCVITSVFGAAAGSTGSSRLERSDVTV